jgi:hypothetical protein
MPLVRHCERSVAIHAFPAFPFHFKDPNMKMDRRAALAMTD